MDSIQPWMRFKVKADTFFLPNEDGSVYFRNNTGSFRMAGASIQSWIETLMPAFDGQHTMADLTDGLPGPYQDRIGEIAGVLFANGFLRDTSQDSPHKLPQRILTDYAPQIEFVDNLAGSGASRFEAYRNADIMAIGSGPMLVSLIRSLYESGLASVNLMMTGEDEETMVRLAYMTAATDRVMTDWTRQATDEASLQTAIQQMDAVLYVSQTGDMDALRQYESICKRAETLFVPAICVDGIGIAGPVLWPGGFDAACTRWDTAWRRMHASLFKTNEPQHMWSETAGALLTNVAVFELFKLMTDIERAPSDRFYTLNAETLEGVWHEFIPASDSAERTITPISNWQQRLADDASPDLADVLAWFAQVTNRASGIFHVWDEGDLSQLPLSQCRVQPINGLSTGPADLLNEVVCATLSHEEARLQAGLAGIEAYARQITTDTAVSEPLFGVGAGTTVTEALGRALTECLSARLQRELEGATPDITRMELGDVQDESCAIYLEALRSAGAQPVIGFGKDGFGFPVVWVEADGTLAGYIGLNATAALQRALSDMLLQVSGSDTTNLAEHPWRLTTPAQISGETSPVRTDVLGWNGFEPTELLAAADVIRGSGCDIRVFELVSEPFITEVLSGVFGVSIHEGES